MKKCWIGVFLLVVAFGHVVFVGGVTGQAVTPEIRNIEVAEEKGKLLYLMRAPLGDTGTFVGGAFICSEGDSDGPKVVTFFGAFPIDRRSVQLAVRRWDGVVERFGAVVSGGPESGFHSPEIFDVGEAERFAMAALMNGSLVSNGYNSFWNRISEEENAKARSAFMGCIGVGG